MKLKLFGFSLLVLLSSCGGNKDVKQEEAPAKEVPMLTARKADAVLEKIYPAHIKGTEDVSIRPRVDGLIDEIFIDEGSVVKKGTPLFRINSPSTEQALRTAEAAVNSSKASLKTAELNVEKLIPLVEKNIVSDIQLKTAKNAKETVEAGLKQAEAALINAKEQRGWAIVTSPVNGVVGRLNYRKGDLVNSATELTIVANTTTVYAYFALNEKDVLDFLDKAPGNTQAEKIKQSQEVDLILINGQKYAKKGKIETISGIVNTQTGSVSLRARFDNSDGTLRSGSSGKIVLPNNLNAIVIPQKATFPQQDKVVVYKVVDGKVHQTVIEVASLPNGNDYVVFSGLNEGDVIVSDDINSVSHNDKVVSKK